ncbi:hypothetical protein FQZ97_1149740 [compost metagenome]
MGGVELLRSVVAVGQERQAVHTKELPLVLEIGQQDFAHLGLAALHGALDFRRLEQCGVGVHRHLELAAGGLVHVARQLHHVLGVEVGGGVRCGQVPFGLGKSRGDRQAGNQGQAECGDGEDSTLHG